MEGTEVEACLKWTLNKTIHVAQVAGYSPGGTETLGTPVPVKAYVEVMVNTQGSNLGSERTTTHLVITEDQISTDDRIWLPGLDPTNAAFSRQPDSVDAFNDPETGAVSHYEVVI